MAILLASKKGRYRMHSFQLFRPHRDPPHPTGGDNHIECIVVNFSDGFINTSMSDDFPEMLGNSSTTDVDKDNIIVSVNLQQLRDLP